MTASEKKKYVCSCLLEKLSGSGFFFRGSALWKYSADGKYVIRLSVDLTRYGTLNEINVEFGSFYTPIQYVSAGSKDLALANRFWPAYYARNTGFGFPLLDIHLSIEEQTASFMPCFDRFVYPHLQTGDHLADYLSMAESLIDMQITAFQGFPRGIEIDDIVYSYLSLGNDGEAVRILMKYALRYEYAEKYIRHHIGLFREPAAEMDYWKNRHESAMQLIESLKADDPSGLQDVLLSRERQSREVCTRIFPAKTSGRR